MKNLKIELTGMTTEEINIIIEKMDLLFLDYKVIQSELQQYISILSDIDINTYHFLMDFSRK
jgi:hypothetical protein